LNFALSSLSFLYLTFIRKITISQFYLIYTMSSFLIKLHRANQKGEM
jgi:hypothetical protein